MPILPSMHRPAAGQRLWRIGRALLYGAMLGVVAALIKIFTPGAEPRTTAAIVREILGAAVGFAVLCAVAAMLRNYVVRAIAKEHE